MAFNKNRTFSDAEANRVWIRQFGIVNTAKDVTGTWLNRSKHSLNGWHVDHKKPVAKKGTNNLLNLQVLAAKENEIKGDNYPDWKDTKGNWHKQK